MDRAVLVELHWEGSAPAALDLLKLKNSWGPKIDMWGVYPEAVACNVGVLCSDFHLGERVLI